jgi:CcmD family protein
MRNAMRSLVLFVVLLVPVWAAADPTSGPEPTPAPALDPAAALQLRKTCADAMNANPTFADDIVRAADKDAAERRLAADTKQHDEAARHIATNERSVIVAYAAMWIVAAGFVIFLSKRQQALRGEIAQLRRDLDAAAKENA